MAFYTGVECPVCGKNFNDNEDIVTCPICGTPHHRECYDKLGKCVNFDKHTQGFEFERVDVKVENVKAEQPITVTPQAQQSTVGKCSQCGNEFDKTMPFCPSCGATNENRIKAPEYSQYSTLLQSVPTPEFNEDNETVDGENVSDIACVVRDNTKRYIPVFKKNSISGKKINWNWAAFLFGGYWYLFRKMKKIGAIFISIQLTTTIFLSGLFSKEIAKFYSVYQTIVELGNPQEITETLMDKYITVMESLMPLFALMFGLNVLYRIAFALFADNNYKNFVVATVKKTKGLLEQGGVLTSQTINSQMFGDIKLGEKEMYKIYLSRLGGTSMFGPIMGYFCLQMATYIVGMIINII